MATTAQVTRQIGLKQVTYSRIQDISATARLLGRASSGAGVTEEITLGTGFSFSGTQLIYTPATSGTVTTVSVVSANGFVGTVANASSTPAITISTTITGLLKGNGTAISAAVANTDYLDTSYTGFDTRYLRLVGGTLTGFLTLHADPTNAMHAATKQYVDNLSTGLSWKPAVRAATTGGGTLATSFANGSVIDGVTLATNDRILIKNQVTNTENGIYVVQASGAPVRALDADSASELDSATVMVEYGTVNANTQWTETATVVTVGTSAVTFAQISGAGTYTNGTGITLTGNVFALDVTYTNTLYVPVGRNLTINGSSQDLSANRTWTITTTGTTNRISVTGGAGLTPTIDISVSYVGQTSITTLGTITSGTWNGTAINLSSYASGTLQAGQFPALTGEATTTAGSLAVTLTNSAVIGKVLTGYISGAGTISASDSILSAIQKLNGNISNTIVTSRYIVRETPTGTVNGTNPTFTLANTPVAGTERVYVNGILQDSGAGNDYTISTNIITFLTGAIPETVNSVIDKVRVNYIY